MSGNPYGVRRATSEDVDALLAFVPLVLSETSLLPLSPEKLERLIERCAAQESGAIAGIIDGPDGVDASVGLVFTESEVSDTPFVRAVWFGLHPNVRRQPSNPKDARAHYGRRLFEFSCWCHQSLEKVAGHPILMQFDLLSRSALTAKMGLYERNLQQVGAVFAIGATGDFKAKYPETAMAAA